MSRVTAIALAALAIAFALWLEPCDGHSCKRPALDIEVTR